MLCRSYAFGRSAIIESKSISRSHTLGRSAVIESESWRSKSESAGLPQQELISLGYSSKSILLAEGLLLFLKQQIFKTIFGGVRQSTSVPHLFVYILNQTGWNNYICSSYTTLFSCVVFYLNTLLLLSYVMFSLLFVLFQLIFQQLPSEPYVQLSLHTARPRGFTVSVEPFRVPFYYEDSDPALLRGG